MLSKPSQDYKNICTFSISFLFCFVFCPSQIFHYDHPSADILHEDFSDRLDWHGTRDSDIQIGAIYINNVTFNDMGTYRCTIQRTLLLPLYNQDVTVEKEVELSVVAVGKVGCICEKNGCGFFSSVSLYIPFLPF